MKNNTLIEKLLIGRNWLTLKRLTWVDLRNIFGLIWPIRNLLIKFSNGELKYIQVQHREDFSTYYSIWCREDYGTQKHDFDLIFDFGANIGLATLYFRDKFPGAEILTFEPDMDTFRILERNVKSLNGIALFNAAIGLESGMMDFYHSDTGKTSGLIREFVNDFNSKVSAVQVHALRDFLTPYIK